MIESQEAYLAHRRKLVSAREGFFAALRTYLRPEQRPDAEQLGDPLFNSAARTITDDAEVSNPVRGYWVILPGSGREFRLNVLQQGNELRIGISVAQEKADMYGLAKQLDNVFSAQRPVEKRVGKDVLFDWHFSAEHMYDSAQMFEDATYKVSAIFEAALQTCNAVPFNP